MEKSKIQRKERSGFGEMAVEGLFGGMVAGIVMLVYLLATGLLSGQAPGVVAGGFSLQTPTNPVQGTLLHLAVSATYGLLFGMLIALLGRRLSAWALALLYMLAIYLLAVFVLMPVSQSRLLQIAPLHFALAHLVYGLVLALWFKGK